MRRKRFIDGQYENIYYQWKNRLLSFGTYLPWTRDLESFVKNQAIKKFWSPLKDYFHPDFAAEISQLLEHKRRSH